MPALKLSLNKSFARKLQGRIERYEFEVGVLSDKPHRNPVEVGLFETPQLGSYAGGPIRKATREAGELSTAQVLVANMKRLNINILQRPFQEENSDIIKFTKAFMLWVTSKPNTPKKRIENLLQAIVRNPILRQEYGSNRSTTADNKGFDRHLFDTGQMFRAIIARATRVRK